MQENAFDSRALFRPAGVQARRGRTRFTLCMFSQYRWMGLLLALATFAPWSGLYRSVPATKPSRRAAGTSSVPLVSLAFGSDGHTLATTDDSGLATLWKTGESWSPVRTLEFEGSAKVVAFARDGRHLAIGGDLRGVALFDLGHPDREQPRQIPFPSLSQLAISPDGQTAAMSSYESHEIILWDLALGRERLTLKGHSATVMHLAFTADGRSLASATGSIVDRPIRVWNVATGRLQRRIGGHAAALQALAFSPDGQLVAGACPHERAIRIWHVGTAGEVAVIDAHSQSTRSIAFSPDGRLMATGAGDGTAALWSVATATEIVRLDCEADVARNVVFSPGGQILAATANDGDIRVWDLNELIEIRPDGAIIARGTSP